MDPAPTERETPMTTDRRSAAGRETPFAGHQPPVCAAWVMDSVACVSCSTLYRTDDCVTSAVGPLCPSCLPGNLHLVSR
jgi:hypothetical protein